MNGSQQRVEITLNKSKITLLLVGALIFVSIGLWLVISPPSTKNTDWLNRSIIAIVGYSALIFFGLCAFYLVRKLLDKKPGLIIDDMGLVDNSSGLSVGQILWTDIENISVIEIHRQKLIMLHVTNPQHYIDRQTSIFKRKGMQFNNKLYGTPLSITSNGLKISFDKLLSLLTDKLRESRK
jgi:hypothetical protein